MNRFKTSRLINMTVFVAGMAVLFAIGCSENPNIAGSDSQPQVMRRSADVAAKVGDEPLYIEQMISAKEGGQLALFDVVLDIPPGAVANDTLFSITIPDINLFFNDFGTDGLVFAEPVKVTMSYRDADMSEVEETTIRIAWLNEETGEYDDMVCEVDFENKVVVGELDHFSAYALISDYSRRPL
jgi:hypothetical protein